MSAVSITLLLCSFTVIAHAQTATTSSTQQEQRAAQQEERQAKQEERASTTQEERVAEIASSTAARQEVHTQRKGMLEAHIQERVTNLAANISNRVEAAISRIEIITTRIESRANKLEANGLDMSETKALIAEVKTALGNVKTAGIAIDTDVASAITSENPRESWKEVKTHFIKMKDELMSTKTLLRKAVEAMKQEIRNNQSQNGVRDAVSNQEIPTPESN